MKQLKSIISLILCMIMVAMPMEYPVFSETTQGYEAAIAALREFGVVESYIAAVEKSNNRLTRADLAVIAVQMMALENQVRSGVQTGFSDVPQGHWASGYIEMVAGLGILVGDANKMFYPDEPVSRLNAVKMLVSLLGYHEVAERSGGYPLGYLQIAATNNLFKGITFENEQSITTEEMLALVYNSLEVPILKQYSFGNIEHFEYAKGVTVLSEYFKIAKSNGIVQGNDKTMLSSSDALAKGLVKIEDTLYNVGTTDVATYLGCHIIYYYKETLNTNERYIVKFSVSKSEIYTISSDKLGTFENNKLTYFDEGGHTNFHMISATVDVIFNGRYKGYYTKEDLIPKNGQVRLVDTDHNGIIDVFLVDSYVTYYVDQVDSERMIVYDKYMQLPLRLEPDTRRHISILYDGLEVDFSKIHTGSVLTVAADRFHAQNGYFTVAEEADIITAHVTSKQVEGVLSEILEEEIYVDEGKLAISHSLSISNHINLNLASKLGQTITVVLDMFGKVAGMDGTGIPSSEDHLYGYVTGCASQGAFKDEIKLFDIRSSEWKIYGLSSKVNIDGINCTSSEVVKSFQTDAEGILQADTIPQLVIYKVDQEDKVNYIDTAVLSVNETPEASLISDGNRGSYRFHLNSLSFGGKFAITNESILLFVPKTGAAVGTVADVHNAEGFTVGSAGMFTGSAEYDMETYNTDDGVAKVAICYVDPAEPITTVLPYHNLNNAVVDSVTAVMYEDKPAYKVYAVAGAGGGAFEFYCDEKTVVTEQKSETSFDRIEANMLRRGDIIRYSILNSQRANRIERIFSLKSGGEYTALNQEQYLMRANSTNRYFSNYLLSYGLLYSNNNGIMQITFNENGVNDFYLYNFNVSRANSIVLYDEKVDRLEIVSPKELYSLKHTGHYGDTVRLATLTASGNVYAVYAYLIK